MSILYNRVRFTEMIDECMAAKDLAPAQKSVQTKREQMIKFLRQDNEESYQSQMKNLVTLFQEFTDLLADLSKAGDKAAAMWANEMRFYAADNGSIVCRCNGLEVVCNDNYATNSMLITTKLTRAARVNIMDCMVNKKIYMVSGPAGSGKTETCKDTLRMLGMEAFVYNCSDQMDSPSNILKLWKDYSEKSGGKNCPIIFDELNRCSSECGEAILKELQNSGTFACITCNPGYAGRVKLEWKDRLPHIEQDFTIPPYGVLMRCMLAKEGVLECDEIGMATANFVSGCKEKMSKQSHYDFGLRFVISLFRGLGLHLRKTKEWDNVKKALPNWAAEFLFGSCVAEDAPVLLDLLKENFGECQDPKICLVDNLVNRLNLRHGCAVRGDYTAEEVTALRKEVDQKCNAKSCGVNWLEVDALIGKKDGNGVWVDGTFTKALRESIKTNDRFHIYVTGNMPEKIQFMAELFEQFNQVLDDNKCLMQENGERVFLQKNVRVIYFLTPKQVETMSPASVSRLGWVVKK